MTQPSNTPSIPDSEARETVLDALDRLEQEATAGPWIADRDLAEYDAGLHNVWHPIRGGLSAVAHDIFPFDDAVLIALSRNHLRALIEVARAAEHLTDGPGGNELIPLDVALAPLLTTEPEE